MTEEESTLNAPTHIQEVGGTVKDSTTATAATNAPSTTLTTADTIRNLKKLNTNFVFFFGGSGSGKTAILSSLIRNIRGGENGSFNVYAEKSLDEGAQLFSEIEKHIKMGRFLPRTNVGQVINLHGEYKPKNPNKLPNLNITFLEMSGEDLSKVKVEENKMGNLPTSIEAYLQISNLPLIFILVTSWKTAESDDQLFAEFLDYINRHAPHTSNNRMILLVSKWDEYKRKNDNTIERFVKEEMSSTYAKIRNPNNIINEYSVGNVIMADEIPYIESFNEEYPSRLWNQIYKTFTGKEIINKKSIFSWLFGK